MAENRVKDFINTVDLVQEQMVQKEELSTISVAVKLEGLDQCSTDLITCSCSGVDCFKIKPLKFSSRILFDTKKRNISFRKKTDIRLSGLITKMYI